MIESGSGLTRGHAKLSYPLAMHSLGAPPLSEHSDVSQ